ncbi:MAG: 16S rRNA (cytosine(1402)-N(4))-methyltransferase RsmH, partial [Oscillospiraceae bacterium]
FHHISVLLTECIEGLNIRADGVYVDGTAGGAGHSSEIAKRLSQNGKLIALDQDPQAVLIATQRLKDYKNAYVIHSNFTYMGDVLHDMQIENVDGVLLDLGVSSHQLDVLERGFSYKSDAPLDMRMSMQGVSAKDIVNSYSLNELTRILNEYGEEKFARRIAFNIIKKRETAPIETTGQLADIVKASIPAALKREKNPCKKTFQAIRIAVNSELDSLSEGLDAAFYSLKSGGRLAIITFHSLEDRMVKQRYNSWCQGCTCPSDFPICVCNNKPKGKLINKKPIIASEEELEVNKRSKSAKLRIIEKI